MSIKHRLTLVSAIIAVASATSAYAADSHKIIAPNCLIQSSGIHGKVLAVTSGFQLMDLTTAEVETLANAKHHGKPACGGFMDVTADWKKQKKLSPTANNQFLKSHTVKANTIKDSKYKIQFEKETQAVLKDITPQNMWDNLTTLTSFKDRYANSKNGVKAADWIKAKIEAIAKETGHDDVTVYFVQTEGYMQPSVVAKFGNSNEPGVVIGGHMDTLNSTWENKPGADDDGSGTVCVLETARTLLASGMKFKKPIYFIWYSAEEMGLVGSGYVVKDFTTKNIPVAAALQLDMTGYAYNNESTIWLMKDFVNKDLTSFLEKLITTYVKQPYQFSSCGYACSDHASWNQAGIPAAFPFEADMGNDDPYIHTANDKMEVLSLSHMTDFVKLATAYAVELAVPAN